MSTEPITVTRLAIRDLHARHPDDYIEGTHDIVAHCSDGKARYCDALFYSRDEAEIALAGWELRGFVEDEGEVSEWEATEFT